MKTSDRGRTWRRVGHPAVKVGEVSPGPLRSLSSHQATAGPLQGATERGGESKALYLTSDGGSRWKRLLNALFEPGRVRLRSLHERLRGGNELLPKAARPALVGAGSDTSHEDAGRNWIPHLRDLARGERGIFGLAGLRSVATSSCRTTRRRQDWELLRTGDGGRSWRIVRSWSRR